MDQLSKYGQLCSASYSSRYNHAAVVGKQLWYSLAGCQLVAAHDLLAHEWLQFLIRCILSSVIPLHSSRRPRGPEKPDKGQRAMDKAHNDAVLAEAATRDPILAHRWAAQQASKAEKAK